MTAYGELRNITELLIDWRREAEEVPLEVDRVITALHDVTNRFVDPRSEDWIRYVNGVRDKLRLMESTDDPDVAKKCVRELALASMDFAQRFGEVYETA